MKLGTTISSVAHVAILSWGLIAVGAPEPLTVSDVEALPIDIVPIEEITQAVRGAKEAELSEKPAPKPTKKQEPTPEAQNTGETENDTKVENDEKPSPVPVKKAEEATKAPEPTPRPTPEPEPVEKAEPTAEATEVAALPDPKTPITPIPPTEEPKVSEDGLEKFAKLPDTVPVPSSRPAPPKPNTAKTNDRKKLTELASNSSGKPDAKKTKKTKDEVANLINKQKSSSGGKKSSTQTAALGNTTGRTTGKLSKSELDALRSAISRCSTGLSGQLISEDLRIKVVIQLAPDGSIKKIPVIDTAGGTTAEQKRFGAAMLRAIKRCAPYDFLPKDKYETWAEIVPTFYPAQMFQ